MGSYNILLECLSVPPFNMLAQQETTNQTRFSFNIPVIIYTKVNALPDGKLAGVVVQLKQVDAALPEL